MALRRRRSRMLVTRNSSSTSRPTHAVIGSRQSTQRSQRPQSVFWSSGESVRRRCRDTIATPQHALEKLVDYLSERRREFQTTLRVLQSYPEDQRHLKPSEKSRTAAELVRTLVIEERVLTSLVNNGATDPSVWAVDAPGSMMKIIEMWQD